MNLLQVYLTQDFQNLSAHRIILVCVPPVNIAGQRCSAEHGEALVSSSTRTHGRGHVINPRSQNQDMAKPLYTTRPPELQ